MKIKKCIKCKEYSFSDTCKKCNSATRSAHPPKFSITDRFGKYRRAAKKQ